MSAIAIDDGAVLWSEGPEARSGRPVLLLLHGYGSDERDLFGLAPFLPDAFVLAAVRAPLAPPFPAPGWSWYPIEGLDGRSSTAVTDAADALIAWLDWTTDAETIGILGFSQGAAVALQALRLRPERFAFVVNLAGYADPTPPSGRRDARRTPPAGLLGTGRPRRGHSAGRGGPHGAVAAGARDLERSRLCRADPQRVAGGARRRPRLPREAARRRGGLSRLWPSEGGCVRLSAFLSRP